MICVASSSATQNSLLFHIATYKEVNQWTHSCSPPTDSSMKEHLCAGTCDEIHQHTSLCFAGETIKQESSSFWKTVLSLGTGDLHLG